MTRLIRRVLRIRAADSPNVARALEQQARGEQPDGKEMTPGVLSWADYCKRMATWDAVMISVGIEAAFYKGVENLLFPPLWLNHSERRAEELRGTKRKAKAVGVDPGEGVADTSMSAVDELGLIEEVAYPTPDTNVIPANAIAFGERHGVPPEYWMFDRGGGGKQAVDRLRAMGYDARMIGFGEKVTPEPTRGRKATGEKRDERDDRRTWLSRRCQLYGELRELIDPSSKNNGFAIPAVYHELRRQLALIPLMRDAEGRLWLPPKNKRPGSNTRSLTEIIGCSPDRADSLCLAAHSLLHPPEAPRIAGGLWG